MTATHMPQRENTRRVEIVEAAKRCFLKFGYAKSSFVDVAKEAGLSRPLLYLHFKSKEELMTAVFESVFVDRYPRIEAMLAAGGTARNRLIAIYDELVVAPWAELIHSPSAQEFYEICERIIPEAEAAYQKRRLRYTQSVLGDRELATVFSLAVDGLGGDVPSAAVLRKRIHRLVERFT